MESPCWSNRTLAVGWVGEGIRSQPNVSFSSSPPPRPTPLVAHSFRASLAPVTILSFRRIPLALPRTLFRMASSAVSPPPYTSSAGMATTPTDYHKLMPSVQTPLPEHKYVGLLACQREYPSRPGKLESHPSTTCTGNSASSPSESPSLRSCSTVHRRRLSLGPPPRVNIRHNMTDLSRLLSIDQVILSSKPSARRSSLRSCPPLLLHLQVQSQRRTPASHRPSHPRWHRPARCSRLSCSTRACSRREEGSPRTRARSGSLGRMSPPRTRCCMCSDRDSGRSTLFSSAKERRRQSSPKEPRSSWWSTGDEGWTM